jgi:hypothetical protein
MFGPSIVICGNQVSLIVVKPEHGVNCSGAPASRGIVAEVRPKVKLPLFWNVDPEILRPINIYLLRAKHW